MIVADASDNYKLMYQDDKEFGPGKRYMDNDWVLIISPGKDRASEEALIRQFITALGMRLIVEPNRSADLWIDKPTTEIMLAFAYWCGLVLAYNTGTKIVRAND